MVTCSEPEVAFDEVHAAEHELAFDELHVSVDTLFNKTDVGSADKETLGAGVVGPDGSEFPPPPPPPPQDESKTKNVKPKKYFFTSLVYLKYLKSAFY